ncbi:MAG TPA: ABC transporter permease [Aggregatilineaceae bacterium]|nr:ABC transporter permease [Aggregatilineaceae bacterium]
MSTFVQLYRASWSEWRRDGAALAWSMLFPIIVALAIGAIFSPSGSTFYRIGLVNEAGPGADILLDAFTENAAFHISDGTRSEELDALHEGQRDAVVVLNAPVAALLQGESAEQTPVSVYHDPSSANASAVLNVIQQTLITVDARLTGQQSLLVMQPENESTRQLSRADTMLPGVLAMSLMLLGLYATALPLVSLREKHILRRIGTTPLSPALWLISQITFRLSIAALQSAILVAISVLVFDLPMQISDLPRVAAVVLLGAATFITLGYFLAGLAKTEEAVQGAAALTFLLFTMLSGALLPLWRIPGWIRPLVDAIPLTYLADALRQSMVSATPENSMATNILVLLAWCVCSAILALRLFNWNPRSN